MGWRLLIICMRYHLARTKDVRNHGVIRQGQKVCGVKCEDGAERVKCKPIYLIDSLR